MVKKKARTRYVIVIGADRPSFGNPLGVGDWTCIVGDDKDEVIQRGIKLRAGYGMKDYELWLGVLTAKVVTPTNFQLVPIA